MRLAPFILTPIIAIAVLFMSVGPSPVRAQIYQPQPPAMAPVTGPNCPQVSGLPTAPAVHLYGVCTYNGGRANVTVPAGLVLRWRYYVPRWWWPPYQQEITDFAYPGQTVATDWFEIFYASYLAYAPVPVYPPPVQPPYTPPYTPPPYTPPMPGLPSPGTPAPPRTPTGVGLTLGFGQGWSVAGWEIRYQSNPWQVAANNCHIRWTREPGWVTDGVITPNDGDIARATTPCP